MKTLINLNVFFLKKLFCLCENLIKKSSKVKGKVEQRDG